MSATCGWCRCDLPWWLRWRSWCPACGRYLPEGGIYLQNGGPPCRADAWAGRPWADRRVSR